MKTQQEIQNKLNEISEKIEAIYKKKKEGKTLDKYQESILDTLQTREDILEWVLEGSQ